MDHQLRKIRKNIIKLFVYWFCHAFVFAYVIERLYWAERGMSVQEVVYVEIIYAIVIVMLEVPSGYLSDRWSRKWMMVLSGFFTCLEFLILIFATTFWHFVMAILVAAISNAIASGTSNALLYDSLKMTGEASQFEKVLGRVRFFKYFSGIVAALVGSIVAANFLLVSTYWLSLVSVTIAFGVAFTFVEPTIRTTEEQDASEQKYAKQAFQFLIKQRSLLYVLLYGVVFGACLTYLEEFYQLYIEWIGVPILLFGVVSAINMFTGSISGLIAYKIKDKLSYKVIFTLAILLFAIGLIFMSILQSWMGLIFMWLAFATANVMDPLILGYLHHRAPSTFRATVESYYSLAMRAGIALVGLVFGYVADHYEINIAFLTLGTFTAIYLGLVILTAKKMLMQK